MSRTLSIDLRNVTSTLTPLGNYPRSKLDTGLKILYNLLSGSGLQVENQEMLSTIEEHVCYESLLAKVKDALVGVPSSAIVVIEVHSHLAIVKLTY